MKKSEVVDLLAYMAAFDRRTVGEADVEAWSELDVIRRNDFPICRRAVTLFFDQEPDPYGRPRYLDPHEFRRCVRLAKAERDRNISRQRAILVGQGMDVDEAELQARAVVDGTFRAIESGEDQ